MNNKPTILILHGWGLNKEFYAEVSFILGQRGYDGRAIDFPGFGLADAPSGSLTLADYAQFLNEYIHAEHIEKPILIGHSFGGRVALKYNKMFPGETRALILTGTPGYTPIPRKKLMIFIYLAKAGKYIFTLPLLNMIAGPVRLWYYYLVGARDFYRAEGVMRDTFKDIIAEELDSCMKAVAVPCLLVWGENDMIVPVRIAKKMNQTISGSNLVIVPNVNHGIPFLEPKKFYDAIAPFLKTL